MKIYRYWSQAYSKVEGRDWEMACWGASNVSPEDAGEVARQKAKASSERFARQNGVIDENLYLYADRPLREEIKEEFTEEGELTAVITRNTYGSLVLNCARVMFIDIDLPRVKTGLLQWLKQLFFARPQPEGVSPELQQLQKIRNKVGSEKGLGMRVYRTANGFRCLVTSDVYEPDCDETAELLKRFGCDPLYIHLCRVQESFRARLTPKCWRCGIPKPSTIFPWTCDEVEQVHRKWEEEYIEKTAGYSTCRFIESLGSKRTHPQVEHIVALHDKLCCLDGLPLA